MATIKRGYYGLRALLAGLLAFVTSAAAGSAGMVEHSTPVDAEALVDRLSDSEGYDMLLLARAGGDADPFRAPEEQPDDARGEAIAPEPVTPKGQPAQALKLKPGEQPRQTFEAWPAGQPQQAAKIAPQPQQALKLRPGEQPQQAAKIAPQPQQAAKITPQPQQALKLQPDEQPQQGQ